MLSSKIKELASAYFEDTLKIRRHIHSNPELSYHEFKTQEFVSNKLTEMGIPHSKMANTGLVGIIEGGLGGDQVVALRGDMDALPITETNDVEYKSKNEGVMHACGHDVHTSSLLGAARILNDLKAQLPGKIKLIFQPAEEKAPGGASIMIKKGVLENPKPHSIIGQHVMPLVDVGKVGFRSGMYMASADEIYFTVKGKGGHGAMPHLAVDPITITAQIIVALQQVVSRMANPATPTVLTFGKVIANGVNNVIPDEVKVDGTFRTFDEEWRKDALVKMKKLATSIAEGFGAEIEFTIVDGYPFLVNEEHTTAKARAAAVEYLGEENVVDLGIWMAAEDFSYYSHHVPACFYRLGIRNESKGITSNVHTPTFNIDEDALKIGTGLMAYIAYKQLLES